MSSVSKDMADFNPSYIGPRYDILSMVPNEARRVLEIGCGIGALGEKIRQRNNAEVTGIEIDERMAGVAKGKLDRVIIGDVEENYLRQGLAPRYFDCIIFADVLEHLKNPWSVLKDITVFLNDNGSVIASIPNVRHHTTIRSLVFGGHWPYRERGIHDRTHLRFFTLKNIRDMFEHANLSIVKISRKYRIVESSHPLNRYSKCFAVPLIRDFFTFKYLVIARKAAGEPRRHKA